MQASADSDRKPTFCPYCGTQTDDRNNLCERCGNALPWKEQQRVVPEDPLVVYKRQIYEPAASRPAREMSSQLRSVLVVLLILLLVAGAVFGVIWWKLSPGWVRQISLPEASLELKLLQSTSLRCSIYPETAADTPVTWNSSNENVVTVAADGTLQAVGVGSCTVTVQAQKKTAAVQITVPAPVLSAINISGKKVLEKGETTQLKATVQPDTYSNLTVKWLSSNASVATVDAAGCVTAVGPGCCVIYAGRYGVSDSFCVTVREYMPEEKAVWGIWDAQQVFLQDGTLVSAIDDRGIFLQLQEDGTGTFHDGQARRRHTWQYWNTEDGLASYALQLDDGRTIYLFAQNGQLMLPVDEYCYTFRPRT